MNDSLPRYWTEPFVDALVAALNQNPKFQKAARSFKASVALRVLDTPDGLDATATYTIESGRVVKHTFETWEAGGAMRTLVFDKKQLLARTTTSYATWLKLDRGEINVAQALVSPDYKIEGSKFKIMRHIGVFTAMGDIAAKLPKRY